MRALAAFLSLSLLLTSASWARAQERLTPAQAVERTLARHAAVRAARAGVDAATAGVSAAASARLPRFEVAESAERGNQPVYAFGSLLAQRRFGQADFDVARLNYPDAITHHRTFLGAEQTVWDAATSSRVDRAREGVRAAEADVGIVERDLALAAVVAYAAIGRASADLDAARAAVAAAVDDRRRLSDRRDAGLATQADVLAADVHVAAMREREIRAASDRRVAMAELNALMGEPLDAERQVEDVAPGAAAPAGPTGDERVLATSLELRRAASAEAMARSDVGAAASLLKPRVVARGGYELAGRNLVDRVTSWQVGGYLRWTFSAGGAEAAGAREARAVLERAGHERRLAEDRVRLGVRRATVEWESSLAREAVGRAATDQAVESHRIVRDRFDVGLATTTDLLRAAEAVADARARHTAARFDVVAARAALVRANGGAPSDIAAAVTPDAPTPGEGR